MKLKILFVTVLGAILCFALAHIWSDVVRPGESKHESASGSIRQAKEETERSAMTPEPRDDPRKGIEIEPSDDAQTGATSLEHRVLVRDGNGVGIDGVRVLFTRDELFGSPTDPGFEEQVAEAGVLGDFSTSSGGFARVEVLANEVPFSVAAFALEPFCRRLGRADRVDAAAVTTLTEIEYSTVLGAAIASQDGEQLEHVVVQGPLGLPPRWSREALALQQQISTELGIPLVQVILADGTKLAADSDLVIPVTCFHPRLGWCEGRARLGNVESSPSVQTIHLTPIASILPCSLTVECRDSSGAVLDGVQLCIMQRSLGSSASVPAYSRVMTSGETVRLPPGRYRTYFFNNALNFSAPAGRDIEIDRDTVQVFSFDWKATTVRLRLLDESLPFRGPAAVHVACAAHNFSYGVRTLGAARGEVSVDVPTEASCTLRVSTSTSAATLVIGPDPLEAYDVHLEDGR
jgi:hypothetical protein